MIVSIIQLGPVYLDLQKSIDKACDIINDASSNKAELIVFGETWLSGYPIWLDICKDVNIWNNKEVKELWAKTYENSIELGTKEMDQLIQCVKDTGVHLVIGANERISKGKGNRSLYNSSFTISPTAGVINHHRKLMPTFTEKLVHAPGDAAGLKSVDTQLGRIGNLICWEHWMPMARQSMHDSVEDVHIALWPWVKEQNHIASRHYAIEGRCNVIAVGQLMHGDELNNLLEISDSVELADDKMILRGGSAIYGPEGDILLKAQGIDSSIIYHELDMSSKIAENMNLSVSGHYQRHDIFDYTINRKRISD